MSTPLLRCREVRPYLSAYVDGELDDGLQEQVKAHVASCGACSLAVERYRALDEMLGTLPASTPSPDVLDQVLAATSRQNRERAIRQSLRRPERPVVHRLLPAFLLADTNLAAPLVHSRNAIGRGKRSWVLVTALPTLAALLLIAVTLISFRAQSRHLADKATPTVSTLTTLEKTDQQVFGLEPQLPFVPRVPTYLPVRTGYQSVNVSAIPGGPKRLDVIWTLPPPYNYLHMREVGVPLADRAGLDYVETVPIALQTWQLPNLPQWVNMADRTNNSGRLVEGADFTGISITLDIGLRGGGNLSEESNVNADSDTQRHNYEYAVDDLRLTSLSISSPYLPLSAVAQPDPNGKQVVRYEMWTTGQRDGQTYRWDVYWDSNRDLTRASLFTSSGTLLYTDYWHGLQVTRCAPQKSCKSFPSGSSFFATDPVQLGGKVSNFFSIINSYLVEGELWNMGPIAPPSGLGAGSQPVYTLPFVTGPYPMTVYVSYGNRQVVGLMSDVWSQDNPGGKDAASPLADQPPPLSGCAPVRYSLIVYLPENSSSVPGLMAPPSSSGGKTPQTPTVATCTQS
jgi:hypothetical protein